MWTQKKPLHCAKEFCLSASPASTRFSDCRGTTWRSVAIWHLEMRDADAIFVTVGTPSLPDGSPDLRYIDSAAEMTGAHLTSKPTLIINKSTIPIGTNRRVESVIRKAYRKNHRGANESFMIAYNPEFLRQGSAIHDTLYPDRIVLGSDSGEALGILKTLYRSIVDQTSQCAENKLC
jgi:UDPglucose 6-dehydrogenase